MKRGRETGLVQSKLQGFTSPPLPSKRPRPSTPPPSDTVVDVDLDSDVETVAGKNAFALMMSSSSRLPTPKYVFELNVQPQRTHTLTSSGLLWQWKWRRSKEDGDIGADGFTASMNVKLPLSLEMRESPGSAKQHQIHVTLRTNMTSCSVSAGTEAPSGGLSVSVIKSCLQKAIRRRRSTGAVRLANKLFILNAVEAIRRLMIIIIEDSTLHPGFMPLVWLMMATGANFVPNEQCRDLFLAIVHQCASCALSDPTRRVGPAPTVSMDGTHPYNLDSFDALPAFARGTLYGLLLRAAYGGMAGDMVMLLRATDMWYHRFSEKPMQWLRLMHKIHAIDGEGSPSEAAYDGAFGPVLPPPDVDKLETDDVPLAGVDFHCSGVLRQFHDLVRDGNAAAVRAQRLILEAAERREDPVESGLRDAMWTFRSGINCRVQMPSDISDSCIAAQRPLTEDEAEAAALRTEHLQWMVPGWKAALPLFDAYARRTIRSGLEVK